jgi:hypothetical protein
VCCIECPESLLRFWWRMYKFNCTTSMQSESWSKWLAFAVVFCCAVLCCAVLYEFIDSIDFKWSCRRVYYVKGPLSMMHIWLIPRPHKVILFSLMTLTNNILLCIITFTRWRFVVRVWGLLVRVRLVITNYLFIFVGIMDSLRKKNI